MVAFWWNILFLLIYNHIRSEFVGKSHKIFQHSLSITDQSSVSTIRLYKLESKSCTRTKELLFAVYDAFITDLTYWPYFQFPLSKKNIMMYHLLMSWVTFEIKVYPCSAQNKFSVPYVSSPTFTYLHIFVCANTSVSERNEQWSTFSFRGIISKSLIFQCIIDI